MSFLKRWQARKEEVAREEADIAAEPEITEEPLATAEAETADGESAEATAEADTPAEPLPDPESIEEGGSFAAFMGAEVDPLKRKEALKSLWKQPQFNVRDGLCEYDLDYTKQPKLSAEVAAELAKKVFRHVTKDEEEQDEALASQDKDAIEAENKSASTERPVSQEEPGQNDAVEGDAPTTGESQA